jgi:hypothetical protein
LRRCYLDILSFTQCERLTSQYIQKTKSLSDVPIGQFSQDADLGLHVMSLYVSSGVSLCEPQGLCLCVGWSRTGERKRGSELGEVGEREREREIE